MQEKFSGRVWKLGNNIDTDLIYPGRYLPIIEAAQMAEHALEGISAEFPKKIQTGDIIVAGSNFGCGSSREQAATSLKAAGISAVIAGSFARIFFRNAINQGLALLTCAELADQVSDGVIIEINLTKGRIQLNGKNFTFPALPSFVMEILNAGGLIPYTRKKLQIKN